MNDIDPILALLDADIRSDCWMLAAVLSVILAAVIFG